MPKNEPVDTHNGEATGRRLMQRRFLLNNFFRGNFKLPLDKFWIKQGEVLLKPHDEGVMAYILSDDESFGDEALRKIEPYVQICSLVTSSAPTLEGGSGSTIRSIEELGSEGRAELGRVEVRHAYDTKQQRHIRPYFAKFLNESKKLYLKYIVVKERFAFIDTATRYFYKSQVRNDEVGGFLDAAIALEALLNDGLQDLKYKIALRAAFLLGITGLKDLDSELINKNIRDFYDLRSDVVHGGTSEPRYSEYYPFIKYLRWTLICFYILVYNRKDTKPYSESSKAMKRNLLIEVDNAILNEKKREKMKSEIEKGVKDFRFKIPRTFEDRKKTYRISW